MVKSMLRTTFRKLIAEYYFKVLKIVFTANLLIIYYIFEITKLFSMDSRIPEPTYTKHAV